MRLAQLLGALQCKLVEWRTDRLLKLCEHILKKITRLIAGHIALGFRPQQIFYICLISNPLSVSRRALEGKDLTILREQGLRIAPLLARCMDMETDTNQ